VFLTGIAITVLGGLVTVALIRPGRAPATQQDQPRQVANRFAVIGDAEGLPTQASCTHLDQVSDDVPPSTRDGCEDCLREGTTWIHLRRCLRCGHIGCCDQRQAERPQPLDGCGHPGTARITE
jgi:hypothetical protein